VCERRLASAGVRQGNTVGRLTGEYAIEGANAVGKRYGGERAGQGEYQQQFEE
jgi:hypothetical protein